MTRAGQLRARLGYERAALRARARLRRRFRSAPAPVLVHQMGKVASSSVVRSLQEAGCPALQTHFLSTRGLARSEAMYRRHWDSRRGGAGHVWNARWVRRRWQRRPGERWRVVTVVRDPVARNVSSLFQVADLRYGTDVLAGRGDEDETVVAFRDHFLDVFDDHDLPLHWLDDELAGPLGVDVYRRPFPREQGYAVHTGERADVLVIRYEDLPRVWTRAVAELLGLDGVPLVRTNVTSTKDHGDSYGTVMRRLTLPQDYLDRMYGSRYARHFWSDAERARMRPRWAEA